MRNLNKLFLCFLFGIAFSNFGITQKKSIENFEASAAQGIFLGKTLPVEAFLDVPNTSDVKRQLQKLNKKPLNFLGRGKTDPNKISPVALPKNEDPVWQSSVTRNAVREAEILVNMEGLGNGSPNDPSGDVGKDHYIQMINATRWQVFNKDGSAASEPMNMNAIWSQVGFNSFGDPIVIYDQEYDRWILTEFAPIGANQLLVAVSETSDPLGSYYAYAFPTPSFPDYPKFALWDNTIYVTTNEDGFGTSSAYFIDRLAMVNGEASPAIQRLTFPGVSTINWYTPTPVDWTGDRGPENDTPPMILNLMDDAWGDSAVDQIDIYQFSIDFQDATNTSVDVVEVPSAPFAATDTDFCAALGAGFACIPQPNGQGIDGIPQVIMHQSHYRNFGSHESIVLNFTVAPSADELRAGIRWMELRRTESQEWYVYQEGTFAPDDGENRFLGGIAMDGKGNIALAYTVSSTNTFPSLRFTGRYAGDPLGKMTLDEVEFATGVSSNGGSRFGDYAQMTIDPENDVTFWFTAEYLGGNQEATTRIVAFEFAKDSVDIGPSKIVSPTNSGTLTNNEVVRIEVTNLGLETQNMFEVGYSFEGVEMEVDQVNFELAPDAVYMHTFDTPVDLSQIRSYDFKVFTSLDGDTVSGNDTLSQTISKLPQYDLAVTAIDLEANPICAADGNISISVRNFGTDAINYFELIFDLNGIATNVESTEILAAGVTTSIVFEATDFLNGENSFTARTAMPNMMTDQNTTNDELSTSFVAITNAVPVFLNILTDQFPRRDYMVYR